MKIIDEILKTLDYATPVRDIRMGPLQTAVVTRHCGLASTPHDVGPHYNQSPVTDAGLLLEKDIKELAGMANSDSIMEVAIGMATINSLIKIDEKRCAEINAGELIASKSEGKKVAIIGHFPFVNRLKILAKYLWVIEKKPQQNDLAEKESEKYLPQADVIGITGTAFTNHTIENLLGLCNPKAYVVILGGTTPLTRILFDYRINAISGTKVVNPESVLRYVSQGATFRQIKGIKLLTMRKDG